MAMEQSSAGLDVSQPVPAPPRRLWPRRGAVSAFLHAHSVAQFTFATILFFGLVVGPAWVWAVNGRMWFLDREYGMWRAKIQMLNECALADTVILGDSRAMADLIPARLGSVVNFALGGGSPIDAYYVAERMTRCPSAPKRVIMSIAALHFTQAEVYWTRSVQFGFLDYAQMEEIRRLSRELGDSTVYATSLVGGLEDRIKNLGYRISLPSYYFPAMLNALFVGRKEMNEATLETTLRSRGQHHFGEANGVEWPSDDSELAAYKPSPVLHHYFERTLQVLQKHGIEVVFVGMPINKRTFAGFRKQVRDDYAAYLKAAAARHPNFRVVGEVMPVVADEYFGDPEHLNARGAEMWSDHVKLMLTNVRSASE